MKTRAMLTSNMSTEVNVYVRDENNNFNQHISTTLMFKYCSARYEQKSYL